MTNTARTLKLLRDQGYIAGVVERFLNLGRGFGKRVDLFNIIDIIAIKPKEVLGVQSCGQAFSEHDKKIRSSPMRMAWLGAGGKLWLVGWRKVKLHRGGKAMRWKPRIKKYEYD